MLVCLYLCLCVRVCICECVYFHGHIPNTTAADGLTIQKKSFRKLNHRQMISTKRMTNLDYVNRFNELKLYCFQQKCDRYIVIMMQRIGHPNYPSNIYMSPKIPSRLIHGSSISDSIQNHINILQQNLSSTTGPALFRIVPEQIEEEKNLPAVNIFSASFRKEQRINHLYFKRTHSARDRKP